MSTSRIRSPHHPPRDIDHGPAWGAGPRPDRHHYADRVGAMVAPLVGACRSCPGRHSAGAARATVSGSGRLEGHMAEKSREPS
jgi:hypothetical protein